MKTTSDEGPSSRPVPSATDGTVSLQPLYEQVYQSLSAQIAAGAYRPGSRLPSERALGEALGVSRLTLRRALKALVDDGLLDRVEGRGWFAVSGPVSEPPNELIGFSAMARSRGLTPTSRVLTSGTREATLDEADELQIAPGAQLIEIERLRLLDGIATGLNRVRVPVARAPWLGELDLSTASLHEAFEAHATRPTTATYVVEVLNADARVAELLDVAVGTGLLLSSGTTFDQRGLPIELGWIAYRPDRYRFRAHLSRRSTES